MHIVWYNDYKSKTELKPIAETLNRNPVYVTELLVSHQEGAREMSLFLSIITINKLNKSIHETSVASL